MRQRFEKFLTSYIKDSKAYFVLLVISLFFIAPILFAGVDYVDDTSRKLEGVYQWGSLGRVVTEAMMHIVTFNFGNMTDPGNLMQILSIPVLALTAFIFAKLVSIGRRLTWAELFVGMQVIPNQLLLANLSFRFDSLSMVLGSFVAVCAAYVLLRETPRTRKGLTLISSSVLLFLAAGLYQSAVMMFVVAIIVSVVVRYCSSRDRHYRIVLKATGVFIIGLLLYCSMIKLFHFKGITGARKELVSLNLDGLHLVVHNFKTGLKSVMPFFSNAESFLLGALVIVVLCIAIALLVYKYAAKRNAVDTLIFGMSPVLMVLAIMGPFVLMQATELTTQVRVLTSAIGVMILATAVILCLYRSGYKWALWLLLVPLLMNLYSMNFAYVYGATLKAQRLFDETVYDSMALTIEASPELRVANAIFIKGEPASPQTVKNQLSKRPALKRMNIAGDNSRWYIWKRLKDEGIAKEVEEYTGVHASRAAVSAVCSRDIRKPEFENEFYSIYRAWDGVYMVWLQDPTKPMSDPCSQT